MVSPSNVSSGVFIVEHASYKECSPLRFTNEGRLFNIDEIDMITNKEDEEPKEQ